MSCVILKYVLIEITSTSQHPIQIMINKALRVSLFLCLFLFPIHSFTKTLAKPTRKFDQELPQDIGGSSTSVQLRHIFWQPLSSLLHKAVLVIKIRLSQIFSKIQSLIGATKSIPIAIKTHRLYDCRKEEVQVIAQIRLQLSDLPESVKKTGPWLRTCTDVDILRFLRSKANNNVESTVKLLIDHAKWRIGPDGADTVWRENKFKNSPLHKEFFWLV